MENFATLARLDEMFGSYKAEWLHEKIFRFFAAPTYFNALKSNRPCVLQGGRGTGKTTVLRSLSYTGQYALNHNNLNEMDKENFVGIYYRANTNHVHAFEGKGITKENWNNIFSHYFNLIFTSMILNYVKWHYDLSESDEKMSTHACKLIATSLHLKENITGFDSLCENLELEMFEFQANINNILDAHDLRLSMCGDPIRIVTEETRKLKQFKDKIFYLLLDEYENFLDDQQQIINGLIKHTPESYTFKIGVREKGWRVKYTLNHFETLSDPADYVLFDIVEEFTKNQNSNAFESFARDVCQLRIKELMDEEVNGFDISNALTTLTSEEESLLLGLENHEYFKDIIKYERDNDVNLDCSPLFKFFISYWSHSHGEKLEDTVSNYLYNKNNWNTRYENYKYSILFKIKRGRGRGGIQKYYCGWNTFVKLANGNIRYLMELVYRSYYLYLQEGGDLSNPIPPEIQTKATQNVGWKNLTELEGTWEKGVQLTRMVQAWGSIFSSLAKEGDDLAPEIVQFEIEGEISKRTEELLTAAVMNLALIRLSANKLSGSASVKDFMYSLHPIFAPYFNFSYRRKRKLIISDNEFLSCIDNIQEGVSNILRRKNIGMDKHTHILKPLNLFDIIE